MSSEPKYLNPDCHLSPDTVINLWEKYFHFNIEYLFNYDRAVDIIIPRHILCYALFTYASTSHDWIAGRTQRNRTTIYNSVKNCQNWLHNVKSKEGEKVAKFIDYLAQSSTEVEVTSTIAVTLNREDIRKLLPGVDPWKLDHWNLPALWEIYMEYRYVSGIPKKLSYEHAKIPV